MLPVKIRRILEVPVCVYVIFVCWRFMYLRVRNAHIRGYDSRSRMHSIMFSSQKLLHTNMQSVLRFLGIRKRETSQSKRDTNILHLCLAQLNKQTEQTSRQRLQLVLFVDTNASMSLLVES